MALRRQCRSTDPVGPKRTRGAETWCVRGQLRDVLSEWHCALIAAQCRLPLRSTNCAVSPAVSGP